MIKIMKHKDLGKDEAGEFISVFTLELTCMYSGGNLMPLSGRLQIGSLIF